MVCVLVVDKNVVLSAYTVATPLNVEGGRKGNCMGEICYRVYPDE